MEALVGTSLWLWPIVPREQASYQSINLLIYKVMIGLCAAMTVAGRGEVLKRCCLANSWAQREKCSLGNRL
jgi:hypothetical protein